MKQEETEQGSKSAFGTKSTLIETRCVIKPFCWSFKRGSSTV